MTVALIAVLALAAGWCVGHRAGRHLRRAAVTAERLARPIPDWEQLAEQARYDTAFDEIRRNYDDRSAA